MKKSTKRALSILLICAMLLALLPAVAFAADEVDTEIQTSIMERVRAAVETAVMQIGAETFDIGIQPLGTVTATGTVWGGAPWRLYSDGTVIVSSGVINNPTTFGPHPWGGHRGQINQIIFQGTQTLGPNLSNLFGGSTGNATHLGNLTAIVGMENWDTRNVTRMGAMFGSTLSLASLDLSNWDTSNVTHMSGMFSRTRNLTCVGDISNWNTGNVTTMNDMFNYAESLTSLDLSRWDTSNVFNMDSMFFRAHRLTSVGDLSNWDTSSATTMVMMFEQAHSLTSVGDLSNWDTSNVTRMTGLFARTSALTSLNLSGWDTRNANTMGWMFTQNSTALGIRELTLGPNFRFLNGSSMDSIDVRSGVRLPAVPNNEIFTGYWQNVGSGTVDNPLGDHVLTSVQLMGTTNPAIIANTWVWQPRNPAVPAVHVGAQVEAMVAGQAGTVTFPVTTTNIVDGNYAVTVANLPTGVTVQGQVTITNGSGILTLAGNTTIVANVHNNLALTLSGTTSSAFTLTIDTQPTPTVTVGGQVGTMTAGQMGTVTFPVTTTNIANGSYTVTVANLPTGVTVQGQVTIAGGTGTLTLAGNTNTLAGVHGNLALTLSSAVSNEFAVTIGTAQADRIIQLNRSGVETPLVPQAVGYVRAPRFSTIVQNVSTTATGGLTVTISGPNASAFEITHISSAAAIGRYQRLPSSASTLAIPSLAVGNAANLQASRRFMVQPVAGLLAGTYQARITVSVDSDLTGQFDEYFDVVFVVQ